MAKHTGDFKNKTYVGYWLPKNVVKKIDKEVKNKSIFIQKCIEETTGWTQDFFKKGKKK